MQEVGVEGGDARNEEVGVEGGDTRSRSAEVVMQMDHTLQSHMTPCTGLHVCVVVLTLFTALGSAWRPWITGRCWQTWATGRCLCPHALELSHLVPPICRAALVTLDLLESPELLVMM